MSEYYINSDLGKQYVNSLGTAAGSAKALSDGATLVRKEDGSVGVYKNGQWMDAVVGGSQSTATPTATATGTAQNGAVNIETPELDSATTTQETQQPVTTELDTAKQQEELLAQIKSAREKAKEATAAVTQGLYTIGTEAGMNYVNQLKNAGDTQLLTDGTTLRREEDGSYSAIKNGQTLKVNIDNDAISRDTLMNEAIRGAFEKENTYTVGTSAGVDLLQQAKATGSSVWANDGSEWSYNQNDGSFYATKNGQQSAITVNKDAIAQEAAKKKAEAEAANTYTIGTENGVKWADSRHKQGDMKAGSDGTVWVWNAPGDVTVIRNGQLLQATIDREAASKDAAKIAAQAATGVSSGSATGVSTGGTSGSYSSGGYSSGYSSKSSSGSGASATSEADKAALRKQAATAQKEMTDLANQIKANKARGRDTTALESQYAKAKATYDDLTAQINSVNPIAATKQALKQQTYDEYSKEMEAENKTYSAAQRAAAADQAAGNAYTTTQTSAPEKYQQIQERLLAKEAQAPTKAEQALLKAEQEYNTIPQTSAQSKTGSARAATQALNTEYNKAYRNVLLEKAMSQNPDYVEGSEVDTLRGGLGGGRSGIVYTDNDQTRYERATTQSSALEKQQALKNSIARRQNDLSYSQKVAVTQKRMNDLAQQIQAGRYRGEDTTAEETEYAALADYLETVEQAEEQRIAKQKAKEEQQKAAEEERRQNVLRQQKENEERKKEQDKIARARTRIAQLGIEDLLREYYDSEGDRQKRLRSTLEVKGVTPQELVEWRNTLYNDGAQFLSDAGTALFQGGMQQFQAGTTGALAAAEKTALNLGAGKAAAWIIEDLMKAVPDGAFKNSMLDVAAGLRENTGYSSYEEDADELRQQLAQTMQDTTKNHSDVGKWVIEQMPSMGNMMLGAGTSGALGISNLATLGTTAGGSAYMDAVEDGASHEQALAYGIATGALEAASEKLFGGNPLVDTDAGWVNKLVSKATKNQTILKILDSKGFDLLSEGLEEVITEITEPWAQALIYAGEDADFATGESILNAFLGGIFMAAIGNVAALPGEIASKEAINAATESAYVQATQGADAQTLQELIDIRSKIATGETLTAEDLGKVLEAASKVGKTISPEQVAQDIVQVRETFNSKGKSRYQIMDGGNAYNDPSKRSSVTQQNGTTDVLDTAIQQAFQGDTTPTQAAQAANTQTAQTVQPTQNVGAQDVITGENAKKISMEDFANNESSVWNNVAYEDEKTKSAIMWQTHNGMVANGDVVTIPESVTNTVSEHFPDMRSVSKSERKPVLKQKFSELKTSLRNYLNGLKGVNYEFEVNGNVLDAKLYETGVREVLDRLTQEKSNMLFGSDQIFRNAQYLYSTPDYDSNPDVYRWNYFYTPVQIGNQTVGVRIAIRDMAKANESQIYHWGIKENATLGGGGGGKTASHTDASSVASSTATVPQSGQTVKQNVSATDSTGAAPSGFDPLSHASNEYGAIPPGENSTRVVDFPTSMDGETKVRRYTRTAAEAKATTNEMVSRIEQLVSDGELDYEVYSNKQAIRDGTKAIEKQLKRGRSLDDIRRTFIKKASDGKAGAKLIAEGTLLYADAVSAGDYNTAADVFVALAEIETNAGQTVQAARLLKSLTPEGRIFAIQKMVSDMEITLSRNGKDVEINVPTDLLEAYRTATTQDAQDTALSNIYDSIAEQVPATLHEGLQQWRYFSMLANPSTHAKNIRGNVSGAVAKIGKDNIAALLETIFIGDKPGQRTKAFLNVAKESDQRLLQQAWDDYDSAADMFESNSSKFNPSAGEINDRRRYWKINNPQNALTKGMDKVLGGMEAVKNFNTKALEVEDMWFSKPMYATALASYMKANHMTEITDAARTYAMTEAKRGTYNDLNAVSKWATRLGNNSKLGRFLAGTIYPFKKVPANVMVRTVEYSPLGYIKGMYDLIMMAKGKEGYTAAKAIDDFAAGTTGTALLAVGLMLAKNGILRATGIGDEEEREQQKNAFGAKDFSILVGDTYIPIDGLTLTGTELLTGAQIWESIQNMRNGDEPMTLEAILDALSKITDPVFDQSMLTGLSSTISTVQNSDDEGLGELATKLAIQMIGNYIGQYVPTAVARVASSLDKNQRSTYIEPDGAWDPIQAAVQSIQKKIPGWREDMAVTYGNWGVPVEGNGAGSVGSAVGKALTPVYTSQKTTDPVEEEIARLHSADSAYSNFYTRPSKKISVDGEAVKLTSEQYGKYTVTRGQTDYALRSAMLDSKLYQDLPDQVKSAAMKASQEYANEIGREAAGVGYETKEKWVQELKGASQEEILKAVINRAVESSDYISPETQQQLDAVNKQYGSADYVGLSDELFDSAKTKANEYFKAVEAAKYGAELSKTQKDLADMSSEELAKHFMDEAINSRFEDTNKSGDRYDEVLDAYNSGEINDTAALAFLPDDTSENYRRYSQKVGVTTSELLEAQHVRAGLLEKTDSDGKVTQSVQDQFDTWLGTKTNWSEAKKEAIRNTFWPDRTTTYTYLSQQVRAGEISVSAAKSELTPTYQAGWSHNVKSTGASMPDYLNSIVEYENRPSEDERTELGYGSVWEWFCDYLNTTKLTKEQKYAIAISVKENGGEYSDKTKKKIYDRLK